MSLPPDLPEPTYFEAHITLDPASPVSEDIGKWYFSQIHSDIELGQRAFKYLARKGREYLPLKEEMLSLVSELRLGVLRCKVEAILFDERFK